MVGQLNNTQAYSCQLYNWKLWSCVRVCARACDPAMCVFCICVSPAFVCLCKSDYLVLAWQLSGRVSDPCCHGDPSAETAHRGRRGLQGDPHLDETQGEGREEEDEGKPNH